jgi:hypothetical protein
MPPPRARRRCPARRRRRLRRARPPSTPSTPPIEPPIEPPIDPPIDPPPVVTTCPVSGTSPFASLAVTDPEVLARFGFARVFDRIRATAAVTPTQTSVAIHQAWWRTFGASAAPGDCDDPTIDPEGYGLRCPRTPELALASVNPLSPASPVQFVPVGLFNRLDLAPADGRHCGEYRIVYALSLAPRRAVRRPWLRHLRGRAAQPDAGARRRRLPAGRALLAGVVGRARSGRARRARSSSST